MTELDFWKRLKDYLAIDDADCVRAMGEKVLEMLSARLTREEGEDLKAQLPAGLKTIWARHEDEMTKIGRDQFVSAIRKEFDLESDAEAERVVRGVFGVLQEGITRGEADDVEAQLPKDLKALWRSAALVKERETHKNRLEKILY